MEIKSEKEMQQGCLLTPILPGIPLLAMDALTPDPSLSPTCLHHCYSLKLGAGIQETPSWELPQALPLLGLVPKEIKVLRLRQVIDMSFPSEDRNSGHGHVFPITRQELKPRVQDQCPEIKSEASYSASQVPLST